MLANLFGQAYGDKKIAFVLGYNINTSNLYPFD
jgi:hypothetical protein